MVNSKVFAFPIFKSEKAQIDLSLIYSTSIAILAVILVGIQFLANRSLWMDEAALALNILSKSYLELGLPLDHYQVAPPLFLWVEKTAFYLFGPKELSLRFFPLLMYLGTLFFLIRLIRLIFKDSFTSSLILTAFVFNTLLIYYSSELKPYIGDVFLLVLLGWMVLTKWNNTQKRLVSFIAVGVIFFFLSQATPIILATTFLALLYQRSTESKHLVALASCWLIGFLIYYLGFVYNHPMRDFMVDYWNNRKGFPPEHLFTIEFLDFIRRKFFMFSRTVLSMGPILVWPSLILVFLGIFYSVKNKKAEFLLLFLGPFFLHALLTQLKLYIFEERTVLYLLPPYLFLMGLGIQQIDRKKYLQKLPWLSYCLLVIGCGLFLTKLILNGFPLKIEEIKESLSYLEQNIQEEDQLIVMEFASNAFWYYEQVYFKSLSDRTTVNPDYKKLINQLPEMKKRTRKLWMLFSHVDSQAEQFIQNESKQMGYTFNLVHQTKGFKTYVIHL